jgi:hypothetical protein
LLLGALEVALKRGRKLACVAARARDEGPKIVVESACAVADIATGVLPKVCQSFMGGVQRPVETLQRGWLSERPA